MTGTVTAFIALGSNLGDREQNLNAAVAALRALPQSRVLRVSSYLPNAPVGCPDGAGEFLNGVAMLETALDPQALLQHLLRIEREMGRDRAGQPRNAPRPLDLDLLLYGDLLLDEPGLQVPHPRMAQRRFVLWPLLQIAPRARDPRTGELLADALAALPPA